MRTIKTLLLANFLLLVCGNYVFAGGIPADSNLLAELKKIPGFEDKLIRPIGPLPPLPADVQKDNPTTPEKVELGKLLFFDQRLSGDTSTPCVKCHDPEMGWGTMDDISVGYPGTSHFRNSHTVLNAAYLKKFFWDGRSLSLEAQAGAAAFGNSAGNVQPDMAQARLSQVPEYRRMFKEAFGDDRPSWENISRAMAAFQRTLLSDPKKVPFERYMHGDKSAMTPEQVNGMKLFVGKGRCVLCHDGFMFTDEDFHNLGLPRNDSFEDDPLKQMEVRFRAKTAGVRNYTEADQDLGLYLRTHRKADMMKFRTEKLRELKYTAPYMHNGVFFTLEEVIDFYDQGGGDDPYGTKSPLLKPLKLADDEKAALVAFMEALSSDEPPFVDVRPKLPSYDPPLKEEEKK